MTTVQPELDGWLDCYTVLAEEELALSKMLQLMMSATRSCLQKERQQGHSLFEENCTSLLEKFLRILRYGKMADWLVSDQMYLLGEENDDYASESSDSRDAIRMNSTSTLQSVAIDYVPLLVDYIEQYKLTNRDSVGRLGDRLLMELLKGAITLFEWLERKSSGWSIVHSDTQISLQLKKLEASWVKSMNELMSHSRFKHLNRAELNREAAKLLEIIRLWKNRNSSYSFYEPGASKNVASKRDKQRVARPVFFNNNGEVRRGGGIY